MGYMRLTFIEMKYLILNSREWSCASCGEKKGGGLNASQNNLKRGLNILSDSGNELETKRK